MKQHIKKIIVRLSGSKIKKTPFPVFLKHGVINDPGPLFKNKFDNQEPDILFAQLKYLKKFYDFISLNEAINLANNGNSLKGKCALTFDDAYHCLAKYAFPILEDLKIPATIFVISDVIIGKNMFWRDQIRQIILMGLEQNFIQFYQHRIKSNFNIREQSLYHWSKQPIANTSVSVQSCLNDYFDEKNITLDKQDQTNCPRLFMNIEDIKNASNLIEFGNHTASHPALSSLSYREQVNEILRCKTFLETLNRTHVPILSLPFGDSNIDTIKAAHSLGYNNIVHHSNKGSNTHQNITNGHIDRYTIPDDQTSLGWMLLKDS